MKTAARTHIGLVRASNQDALIVEPGEFGLYGVADGMGGHKAGDVASKMAVEAVARMLRNVTPSAEMLRAAIMEANLLIYEMQLEHPEMSGMGTTFTMIWEDQNRVLLGHVGDSRAYRLRDGELEQISQDHSMVAELVRDGFLTPEEARVHPYRNIITRALGTSHTVEVDVMELDKRTGDTFLICSDGLSEYVRDPALRSILLRGKLDEEADELLQLALSGGGRDNVSLVIAEVTA